MSVIGVPMLLGPVFGPVIGGLIVDNASWRWIFFVNVPIAVFALVLAHRVLTADQGRADAGRLDWRGLALLSPGLGGVVFGLSESESKGGFGHAIVFGPIVVGIALVVAFVFTALRTERPLIDMSLFRSPAFSSAALTTFLVGGALFGAMIVLPLYYQVARGESALDAGLLMAPQGVGAALAMPFAGRLTDRIGGGPIAIFGLIIATAATLPFAFVQADSSYGLLGGVLVARGIGIGCTMMPAMAAAYAVLEGPDVPRATSALNVIQRVGGSMGTAVLAVILQHELKGAAPAGGSGGGQDALRSIPDSARQKLADPFATAFGHTFVWAVVLTAAALAPAVVLTVTGRRAKKAAAAEAPPPVAV
jgi:EmrB/QacA subfamily drug resistance transporter